MTIHEVVHEMVVREYHEPNSEGPGSAWKVYINAMVVGLFLLVLLEYPNGKGVVRATSKGLDMALHWSGVGVAPLMSPRQDETSEPLLYAGWMAGPYRFRQFFVNEIGNGTRTSMWYDNWYEISPLSNFIDNRCLYDARLMKQWYNDFPILHRVGVPHLIHDKADVVRWKTKKGQKIYFSTQKAWLDIKEELPKEQIIQKMANLQCNTSIWSILNRIILACIVYHIWKERNERVFTLMDKDAKTVLQVLNDQVRLQLMSLRMKKSVHTMKVANLFWKNLHGEAAEAFITRVTEGVTPELGGRTTTDAEQMWNRLGNTTREAAKETLGVVAGASRTHIGRS
ncbi:hypothetical protein Tco_0134772 [Tanacetum coccineum]